MANAGITKLEMQNYPFGSFGVTNAIRDLQCDLPLLNTLKAIDLLFTHNKLNNMAINTLRADTFFIIKHFNENPLNKKCLLIIIKEFEILGSYLKVADTDYKKDLYIKLNNHLQHIEQFLNENKVADTKIDEAIKNAKDKFADWTLYKNELKEKGYISDNSIT